MSHLSFQRGLQSRREFLAAAANGFGALSAAALMEEWGTLGSRTRAPHFAARARNVIFLYMDGGPSQIDTFDPKPRLDREHGQPIQLSKVPKTQFDDVGTVLRSPWAFHPRGECGMPISDLLPHIAQCTDELALIRSMTSRFSEHTFANYFLHTGHGLAGRPSAGAWVSYGLGSENRDLPGFVVLNGGLIPPGGIGSFSSGFLSATHQASLLQPGLDGAPLPNVQPLEVSAERQRQKLDLVRDLDRGVLEDSGGADALESAIAAGELAFRMQSAVPELVDLSGESEATRRLYGLDAEFEGTRTYAAQCLLARRLVERGVRFVELTCPKNQHDRWDQHDKLEEGHADNARAVDQPIAGLLRDLRSRGLLDTTLVVWAGEFGRTPMAQGSTGRDHNPYGFSVWLAGGGVKGGTIFGATDDYGYFAVENKVEMYDLHATILHLLGLDHERLTVRFSGRDMRLTDVHGHVIHEVLA